MRWLDLLLAVLAMPVLLAAAYLFTLALVARRMAAPTCGVPKLKLDVVVPAHNEAFGIARTVESLLALDYPRALFRVRVIADNCTDDTAALARQAGADVLVREDRERRGKGYALELAFERSVAEGFDAAVVVDADSRPSANLLRAFHARLERGAGAIQAHYGVLNPHASWRTRLLSIALALFHVLRSLARERLGVSCGLRGNGMCFSARVLREVPHRAFSLVEDLEYGIRLGLAGHRVQYAGEAQVLGEMVSGGKGAVTQRRRWEGGRLKMAKQHGFPLLVRGLARMDLMLLDLAMDVLVPPLSLLVLAELVGVALGGGLFLLAEGALAFGLFALALGMTGVYVLRGWSLSGVGWRGLADLLWAPAYIAWKLALLILPDSARKRRDEWVRTAREGETR